MLWREMFLGWLAVGKGLTMLAGAVGLVAVSAVVAFKLLTPQ